jgi:hypothetical protein
MNPKLNFPDVREMEKDPLYAGINLPKQAELFKEHWRHRPGRPTRERFARWLGNIEEVQVRIKAWKAKGA